jgi:hypothetical protein
MAAVKKKKKEKSTNPNLVLIIFVVFLFLVTIGLGIWVYYEHDAQKQLRDSQYSAKKALEAEKVVRDYYSMLSSELRMAVGDALEEDDALRLKVDREDFWKENFGKFQKVENRDKARKLLVDLKARLGVAENDQDPKTNFKKKLDEVENKARDLEAKLNNLAKDKVYLETIAKKLADGLDEFQNTALARIEKGKVEAVNAAQKRSDDFRALEKSNQALKDELKDKEGEIEKRIAEHQVEVNRLNREKKKLEFDLRDLASGGGAAPVMQANAGGFAPLILSLSTGKPLWDQPVGKIIRYDPDLRQVAINVGSAQGAKPELTFNIFGANSSGRAAKQLKGSIEIIRVVDANTSLARIVSLYDVDGREIQLNDLSRSRIVREAELPIREGDLLFNLFWGARVAIAGYVSVMGDPSDNPAEQISQMAAFKNMLERNGMQVDAYVDLRDGKIRGDLSMKTRYLILGENIGGDAAKLAPKDGDDKDPTKERARAIGEARNQLFTQAMQRGLLMISAENFVTVIGYRRPRNGNNPDISTFRPELPYAGDPAAGGVIMVQPKGDAGDKGDMKDNKDKDNKDNKDNKEP